MRREALAFLMAMASGACGGCADGPDPFIPAEREPPSEAAWQLTFNPGDDRAPAWTADGQRVIYTAEGFLDAPPTPGVILGVPSGRGVSETALRNVQEDGSPIRWFTTPAVATDGERLAFAHVIFTFGPELCGPSAFVDCGVSAGEPLPLPRLGTVALRVRRFDATGPLSEDPALEVEFGGRFFDDTQNPDGLPGVWIIEYRPFHQVYAEEGTLIFRPAWSPEGDRVVFSDGDLLHIWDIEAGTANAIPGTAGGASPAWSPDGRWIAFTRYESRPPETSFCRHFQDSRDGPNLTCAEQRTTFTIDRRVLSAVRPDGGGLVELGAGEEAAWGPDGETVFYRAADRIWRRDRAGGSAMPIAETEGGREPAVSPDGRHLAFARRGPDGTYSIWIVALEL